MPPTPPLPGPLEQPAHVDWDGELRALSRPATVYLPRHRDALTGQVVGSVTHRKAS